MPNNPAKYEKYEVLIKQYLRSITDISGNLKIRRVAKNFDLFGTVVKHCLECLISSEPNQN